MGFVMGYNAEDNILRVTLEGHLTDAVMLDAYEAATKYVASHGPCRAIADVSRVTKVEVSSHALRQLAGSTPAIPVGYTRVFVAPRDSMYGMVRMFQILTELTRPDLHVVRTIDEAYYLLRVESPEFRPIS
jgi:hypothetical protein